MGLHITITSKRGCTYQKKGYTTLQHLAEEEINDTNMSLEFTCRDNHKDPLTSIYTKAANPKDMSFTEYCAYMRSLNPEHRHIVMYNRLWCKEYVYALRKNTTIDGYRVFLSGPGGTGKSHVLKMIQRDMRYFVHTISNTAADQPIVLMTAPTGSAAYQIGGSTIDSTLLLYDNGKNKASWEKRTIMQIKLQNLVLLTIDEISMVGAKKFLDMNKTLCSIKGTHDANWGNICVLAVGDLYQLPPVGQSPIYRQAQIIHTLNDFVPNGWEQMKLHELTQTM